MLMEGKMGHNLTREKDAVQQSSRRGPYQMRRKTPPFRAEIPIPEDQSRGWGAGVRAVGTILGIQASSAWHPARANQ